MNLWTPKTTATISAPAAKLFARCRALLFAELSVAAGIKSLKETLASESAASVTATWTTAATAPTAKLFTRRAAFLFAEFAVTVSVESLQ